MPHAIVSARKSLTQIELLVDLDARVINAAARLEFELLAGDASAEVTLGELVQQQSCFQANGFLRDLNFALGIRNSIAHWRGTDEPTDSEKERSAVYLLDAVRVILRQRGCIETDRVGTITKTSSQSLDVGSVTFHDAREATNRLFRARRKSGFIQCGVAWVATFVACVIAKSCGVPDFPGAIIPIGGGLFGLSLAAAGFKTTLSREEYYSLPGSRFSNHNHRCIHCGHRGVDGRGIYTHGAYKQNTRFHDCSKCGHNLFVS